MKIKQVYSSSCLNYKWDEISNKRIFNMKMKTPSKHFFVLFQKGHQRQFWFGWVHWQDFFMCGNALPYYNCTGKMDTDSIKFELNIHPDGDVIAGPGHAI